MHGRHTLGPGLRGPCDESWLAELPLRRKEAGFSTSAAAHTTERGLLGWDSDVFTPFSGGLN